MYGLNILRGELLLDREYPAWLSAIDLDALNLGSNQACVLGQVEHHADPGEGYYYGLYQAGMNRLGLDGGASDQNPASPHYNGFDAFAPSDIWVERVGDDGYDGDYMTLTREWRTAIEDRRDPADSDALAYAYGAALHHADCILVALGALTREENAERQFTVEHALDLLAEDYGVGRSGTFDQNDFPAPITDDADLVREDGTPQSCDTCLQVIEL